MLLLNNSKGSDPSRRLLKNNEREDEQQMEQLSDCSGEVPSESESCPLEDAAERMAANAASYQPQRYNEEYHRGSKVLKQ